MQRQGEPQHGRRRLGRTRLRWILLLPAFAGIAAPLPTPAAREWAWTPETLLQIRELDDFEPSPDGKRVLYSVTEASQMAPNWERPGQVFVVNADGSGTRALTSREFIYPRPRWSPDGKLIAFRSLRAGVPGLYVMDADGGSARPVLLSPLPILGFTWSPDGKHLAYVQPVPSDEAPDANAGAEAAPVSYDLFVVSTAAPREGEGRPEPRRLTRGLHITPILTWSPDSRRVAFSYAAAGDVRNHDIAEVDVATGALHPLATAPLDETSPSYAPDGQWIAVVARKSPRSFIEDFRIHLISPRGGRSRVLPETPDAWPNLVGWSRDSKHLYFTESYRTASRLYAVDTRTGSITPLSSGKEVFGEFGGTVRLNAGGTHFGFTLEKPDQPPEVHVSPVERFAPVRVSRVHAALDGLPVGKTELIRWKSFDGKAIEGLLTYPPGYRKGKRVPLLLLVHGGPAAAHWQTHGANTRAYPVAPFAERGYAVLRPNPRGSTGYGRAFRFANVGDLGGGDYRDLLAGIDHVIELGVADPARLGVAGWSYGGYMAAWMATRTDRFRAAAMGAGISNLTTFADASDQSVLVHEYLRGRPWEQPQLYRERSPLFFAERVRTPMLIQHGEHDPRVPASQAREFYQALQQRDVPARLQVFPGQGHSISDPAQRKLMLQTLVDWFDRHLLGEAPGQ